MLKANPAPCCGVPTPCCGDSPLPDVLLATFTDEGTCACIDGMTVLLHFDPIGNWWIGTGPGGGSCSLRSAVFTFGCSSGGSSCGNFFLTISTGTCITSSVTMEGGCNCDPLNVVFHFSLVGLSCCDSMFGSGLVKIAVTT